MDATATMKKRSSLLKRAARLWVQSLLVAVITWFNIGGNVNTGSKAEESLSFYLD